MLMTAGIFSDTSLPMYRVVSSTKRDPDQVIGYRLSSMTGIHTPRSNTTAFLGNPL